MDKQQANKLIAEKLAEANTALAEAQEIADEAQVSFYWDGPTYGMGGHYDPTWESSDCYGEDDGSYWQSSSQSC